MNCDETQTDRSSLGSLILRDNCARSLYGSIANEVLIKHCLKSYSTYIVHTLQI